MKTKKKASPKIEHFFSPILGEDQKKSLQQEKNTFFPKFTLSCTPFQIIGGDTEVNHSQTIGGDTAKLLGEIYPPISSAFRHHWYQIKFLCVSGKISTSVMIELYKPRQNPKWLFLNKKRNVYSGLLRKSNV